MYIYIYRNPGKLASAFTINDHLFLNHIGTAKTRQTHGESNVKLSKCVLDFPAHSCVGRIKISTENTGSDRLESSVNGSCRTKSLGFLSVFTSEFLRISKIGSKSMTFVCLAANNQLRSQVYSPKD